MKKTRQISFDEWFDRYGFSDVYLFKSLDAWQIEAIKEIAKKSYRKGKKSLITRYSWVKN